MANSRSASATIGTHSGTFHCDETLAVAMLKILPKFEHATVVRSRDKAVLDECDIVVDVGDEYNAETLRFDHHMRGFFQSLTDTHKTPLSSSGLIYKHFGREVLVALHPSLEDSPNLDVVYSRVYSNFLEAIDAVDNGYSQFEEKGSPRYSVRSTVSDRVGRLNMPWNADPSDPNELSERQRFDRAVELVGGEFRDAVHDVVRVWLPARAVVQQAVAARPESGPMSQVIILERFCTWKRHLSDLERELGLKRSHILYVIYEDRSGSSFRVQTVGKSSGQSFADRKSLPAPWRGLRDDALSEATGVPGCVFCHKSGFVMGATTLDAVVKLATLAVEFKEEAS